MPVCCCSLSGTRACQTCQNALILPQKLDITERVNSTTKQFNISKINKLKSESNINSVKSIFM